MKSKLKLSKPKRKISRPLKPKLKLRGKSRRRNPDFPEPYPISSEIQVPSLSIADLANRPETLSLKVRHTESTITVPKTIAYNLGFDIGQEDIEDGLWDPKNVYHEYIRTIDYYLKENKFDFKLSDYKLFILGYFKAKIEKPPRDAELIKEFNEIKLRTPFFNPLLADHSRVLKIVYSGYDKLIFDPNKEEEGFNYSRLLKPLSSLLDRKKSKETSVDIAGRLNQGVYYAAFIVDNLIKFKYLTRNFFGFYNLTDKGKKIVSNIGKLPENGKWNENSLVPKQYYLMSDIERYLST